MPRFSANLSFLYTELPFMERFAAAAKDGFAAVEYMSPYAESTEVIAEALAKNGLTQALFNLPAGDWVAGERGLACLPDRVEEFRAGIDVALSYAEALGCTRLNCLAGIAPANFATGDLERTLIGNLRYAAPRLADAGVQLLLEPINTYDMPGFFISTATQAEQICDAATTGNLFIQYDFYHAQMMRTDLMPIFERLQHRIAHVQVADAPGRHEPDSGEIDYSFIFSQLDRLGYDSYVGAEYIPRGPTSESLGWMRAWT
jgi:hydroxypyruvate isomerase